jgi:hypothetical protein
MWRDDGGNYPLVLLFKNTLYNYILFKNTLYNSVKKLYILSMLMNSMRSFTTLRGFLCSTSAGILGRRDKRH